MFISPTRSNGRIIFSNESVDVILLQEKTNLKEILADIDTMSGPSVGKYDYFNLVRFPNLIFVSKIDGWLKDFGEDKATQIISNIDDTEFRNTLKYNYGETLVSKNYTDLFAIASIKSDGSISWRSNTMLDKVCKSTKISKDGNDVKITGEVNTGEQSNAFIFVNEIENILIYKTLMSQSIIEKIQNRIANKALSNHYMVFPVYVKEADNKVVVLKNRQIDKMSIEQMLVYFGCGSRKGSKIETLKECLRQLHRISFSHGNQHEGKKFFVQIYKHDQPIGTPSESLPQDMILSMASRFKILATHQNTRTKSLCLFTQVMDKEQDDFANCFYHEIENSPLILFGHHMEHIDLAIERTKKLFSGKEI